MKDELAVRDESDSTEALISICSDNHFRESSDHERDGCFKPQCFVCNNRCHSKLWWIQVSMKGAQNYPADLLCGGHWCVEGGDSSWCSGI